MNDAVDLARLQAAAAAPAFDRIASVKRARELLAPSLREREAPDYPVNALGPLAAACQAISEHGQVQQAMAGQCLLGAASLLTQGLYNVQTLAGKRPLSLYLITLGDSGDGKSTAQNAALSPVNEWQRKEVRKLAAATLEYQSALAAAKAQKKKAQDLPAPPPLPYRLCGDSTVEGLRRDLQFGVCSQGIFTDEAAAMLAGYGMSADHRAKTAGVFSKLWDSGHLSVSRVEGGRVERYGQRVAMHLLIQPLAVAEVISDPLLAALGFWPRYLCGWPPPLQPRVARPFNPAQLDDVKTYWARCEELLKEQLPEDADHCPVIGLSDAAQALVGQAFERFEVSGRRGELRMVKPFALRAAEQVCRVAGVMSAFAGERQVSVDTMRNAIAIVSYSLETWRAIVDEGTTDPTAVHALRLYEWLTQRPAWRELKAAILRGGPACVRTKEKRDAALEVLMEHGLVMHSGDYVLAVEATA